MLSKWLKKLVLASALAVMPVQGIAGTLAVLLCHGDAQAHASHVAAAHDHGGHAAAQAHDGPGSNDEGSSDTISLYHLCCNLAASVPPSATISNELPKFDLQAFVPNDLHGLFVPEQPQRPPLA